MSKRQILMLLGFLVLILPLSGFSSFWDSIIQFLIGIAIIFFAYQIGTRISGDNLFKNEVEETKKIINPNLPFVDSKNPSVDIDQKKSEVVTVESNIKNN